MALKKYWITKNENFIQLGAFSGKDELEAFSEYLKSDGIFGTHGLDIRDFHILEISIDNFEYNEHRFQEIERVGKDFNYQLPIDILRALTDWREDV